MFFPEAKLKISSAVTDIGTGTYTILTQNGAEISGLELADVEVDIGDSSFSEAPLQGGSWTASTLGSATQDAGLKLCEKIFHLAQKIHDSRFARVKFEDVVFVDSCIALKTDLQVRLSFTDIVKEKLKAEGSTMPNALHMTTHARNTHSAVFVEVKIDEDFRMIQVSRVVSAIAAGRILNPKTARSQILGGVVWGIS